MSKRRTYSDEQLILAVQTSDSIRQVLGKLNLHETGANYKSMHKRFAELSLDTSHFTGQLWRKHKTFAPKRTIDVYLSNEFSISSHDLRRRLIKEGYFSHQCCRCKSDTWLGQPIPLELEHKDGNHYNNALDNLEILCPNCHAQTPTYRGRNVKSRRVRTAESESVSLPPRSCLCCQVPVHGVRKFCSSVCSNRFNRNGAKTKRVQNRPPKEELIQMVANSSYCAVGRKFGVSDNAIRKWLK